MSTPTTVLNNGVKMPFVGLGSWMGWPPNGEACRKMCETAIRVGYRHFDTAAGYMNEENVGEAIKDSGIPRVEFFVTTKLANVDHHRVAEALAESLVRLKMDYVDLYLMHWPQANLSDGTAPPPGESPTFVETWRAMEELLGTGKVRAIGVSNFSIMNLEVLLPTVQVVPAVNQVQIHPCLPQNDLIEYCKAKGIHLTAYTPIGNSDSPWFSDETFLAIAKAHNAMPAQVVLSWSVNRGTSVIPKSENEARLRANLTLLELSPKELKYIDGFHKNPGMHKQIFVGSVFNWEKRTVFGWTFDQLGFNWDNKGHVMS